MIKYLYFLLISICLVSIAYSGTTDPKKPDDLYLRIASKYKCCHRLYSTSKSTGKITSSSSCVLVKPNIVLTAAHIITLHNDCNFHIDDNGKRIKINKAYVPKIFDIKKVSRNDVAVCILSSQASSEPCEISFIKPSKNTQVTIAGYGMLGDFNTGSLKMNDNKLRAGFNRIDGYENQCMITSAKLGTKLTSAEYIIVGGDSGGGVFLNGKVIGINSYISAKNRTPKGYWNDECGHTTLYYMKSWINTILDQN